jgi:hypothetical protein
MAGITTKYAGVNYFADFDTSGTENSVQLTESALGLGYRTITMAGNINEKLAVGVNFKMAEVRKASVNLCNGGFDWFTAEGSGNFYDLGVLYQANDHLKLGLMARNFMGKIKWKKISCQGNPPPPLSVDLDKSYLIGMAFHPNENLLMAVDLEAVDAVDNRQDQTNLHVGLEQGLARNTVKLRMGAFTERNKPAALTTGIGLQSGPVLMDLGAINQEKTTFFLTVGFKF